MISFLIRRYRVLGYGHKARALYAIVVIFSVLTSLFAHYFLDYDLKYDREFFLWTLAISLATIATIYLFMSGTEFIAELPWFRKAFRHGHGGSARFGGSGTFYRYRWRSGNAPIYLGRTLGKHDVKIGGRDIGVDDEGHMVTIAQTRSGKSTTVIFPNLVKYAYPDSVFVLDPKGEHAEQTSRHRAKQGQRVIILDPTSQTNGLQTHRFNPLAELNLKSGKAKEDIQLIAAACVVKGASASKNADHFNEIFQTLFAGLIAHVMSTEPKRNQHLPRVYELFKQLGTPEGEALIKAMLDNTACGNLPSDGAQIYNEVGKNERGSLITTCIRMINWISSEGMREHLLSSDFELSVLRTEKTSLYVVLPFEAMDFAIQGRYMRILITLAFKACRETPLPSARAKRRTLFILDEVAQLGAMPELQKAYQTLAGSNVKVWTFYQEYSGLAEQMENTAAVTSASTKQFFGCNDPTTAKQISEYLGSYKAHDPAGRELTRPLLDQQEVDETLGQNKMVQIVKTSEGDIMELTREPFYPDENARPRGRNSKLKLDGKVVEIPKFEPRK